MRNLDLMSYESYFILILFNVQFMFGIITGMLILCDIMERKFNYGIKMTRILTF